VVCDELSLISLFFISVLLIFCFFALYNIPVVVSGVRSLLRARKKRAAYSAFSGRRVACGFDYGSCEK
jgi:hypothetical protein